MYLQVPYEYLPSKPSQPNKQPTFHKKFEKVEIDHQMTLETQGTLECEIKTEILHAYFQLADIYRNVHQNQKISNNKKQVYEITLKPGADKQ